MKSPTFSVTTIIYYKMPTTTHMLSAIPKTVDNDASAVICILFGSAAADALRADSDVDIAVLLRAVMTLEERASLVTRFQKQLHREVDLVDLSVTSGALLKQILTKGIVVTKKDPRAYAELIKRMIYNQEDYMPYFRRALKARRERFLNG